MKKLSKVVIIVLACLIAISSVSLGKVFAYFSAKSSTSGTVTMGHLSISDIKKSDGTDINWDITNLQPNQSFGGSYKVEVTSNINYYIRILFKANVTPLTGKSHATNCGDEVTDDTDILNIVIDGSYTKSDTKTSDGYTAYYKLSPRTVTSATTTETFSVDLKAQNWVGSGSCDYYMGATVSINMQVEVMQADYLNSQNAGGTVSSANEMNSLWSSIAYVEEIKDVEEYSDTLLFSVISEENRTVSVQTANQVITEAIIPAKILADGVEYTVTTVDCATQTYASINPQGAFVNCLNLTSVVLPWTIQYIGEYAFYNCPSLESIIIPSGATVGYHSFEYCTGLTSVTILDNVEIGFRAFYNCSSLTSVTITDNAKIDGLAFHYCTSLQYNIYDNAKYLGNADNPYVVLMEATSTNITSCTINSNCKVLAGDAFANCSSLTSITIPDSVTSIGSAAFHGCSALTTITIPESIASIKSSTFYSCTNLTSVTIPDSVTSVGSYAFYNCTNLTSVTFENTTGWHLDSTTGTSINVSNPTTNATNMKSSSSAWYNKNLYRV